MAKISNIMRVSDIDMTKVTLSAPKVQDNGGKMIYMSHKGEKMFLQLPVTVAPYGLSIWPSDKGYGDKINLDLSMVGYDATPIMKDTYKFFTGLEELVLGKAIENSMSWFKKKITGTDVIAALFTPLVKFAKDKETGELTNKYPPVIRLSIPKRDGEVSVEVYNEKREQVDFDKVEWKGASVTAIVEITSIWIIGGKFGVSMRAKQLKVVPVQKITGYAFIVDDEDADNIHDDADE